MNGDKETLWQAYLDGELSAAEASAFTASLSDREHEQLLEEIEFHSELSEVLSADADCPDDVWERTQASIASRQRNPKPAWSRAVWYAGTVAAAASIALLISVFTRTDSSYSAAVQAVETVDELKALSMVEPGAKAAQEFLHAHDTDIDIHLDEAIAVTRHHGIAILGAREDKFKSGSVTGVLYVCCDRPVKIIMAKLGSKGADIIAKGAGASAENSDVLETRVVGDYIAAVVSSGHGARDLLAALSPSDVK